MKHTNTIVMVIIAAAILIAAYAIGLFIRHARMEKATPGVATPQALVDQHAPGGRRAERKVQTDTLPQKKALLEKVNNMTEEERRKFTEEQVLKRVGASGSGGQSGELSAQERGKTLQARPKISEEEKQALQGTTGQETGKDDTEPSAAGQE